ncbi:MAG: PilN domain-containing protein [Terriglobales bacterium]
MRVDINLATHPYEDLQVFWVRWGSVLAALGALLLVLLFLITHGWEQSRSTQERITYGEQRVAKLDAEKSSAEAVLNRPENRVSRDRSQFLNDLFERKAFSWTQVFEDLERIMPPRVHVVSIRPDMSPDNQLQIKLIVAGDSPGRVLELVRKMESSQHFRLTEIHVQTSMTDKKASGDTVSFDISALYVPQFLSQTPPPAQTPTPGGPR